MNDKKQPSTPAKRKRKKRPAKTPPPPAKRAHKNGRAGTAGGLRQLAGIEYTTRFESVSVRVLGLAPPFDTIPLRTLQHWALVDRWPERRQKYFARIVAKAEEKLGDRLVKARLDELKSRENIADSMAVDILAGNVESKSQEGMVSALTKLLDSNDSLRERITKSVAPTQMGGPHQDSLPVTPTLTDEEARAAASAVIQIRRTAARQQIQAGAEEKGTAVPRLRVINGDGGDTDDDDAD